MRHRLNLPNLADPRRAAQLLAWTLLAAYSLTPFEFAVARQGLSDAFPLGSPGTVLDALDLLLHGLAFAGAGILDRIAAQSRAGDQSVLPSVLLRGIAFCAATEIVQVFMPGRHATITDLTLNAAGVAIGHTYGPSFVRHASLPGETLIGRSHVWRWGPLALWGLFWGSLLILPSWFVSLRGWDSSYQLLIANEKGGERPWMGEIGYLAVYEKALSRAQVQEIAAFPPGSADTGTVRRPKGLLAAYDFTLSNGRVQPDGSLESGSFVSTAGAAETLTAAIASTGEFSVEVWCRPANLFQTGPARIVGISDGIWRRNFTLGQEGDAAVFRVRNRLNGDNGTAFELRASGALSREAEHVVATYSRGISSIYVHGRRAATVDLREPSVLLGLGTRAASRAVTALLAALSLILVFSCARAAPHPSMGRLLLTGYALLIPSLALGPLLSHTPATGLHLWFAPMLIASRIVLGRRNTSS
jgi:VanZ family protein